jgi:hypothetical protein
LDEFFDGDFEVECVIPNKPARIDIARKVFVITFFERYQIALQDACFSGSLRQTYPLGFARRTEPIA